MLALRIWDPTTDTKSAHPDNLKTVGCSSGSQSMGPLTSSIISHKLVQNVNPWPQNRFTESYALKAELNNLYYNQISRGVL